MIFLNYKTYQSGTGEAALLMSKLVEEVSKASGVDIFPIVQVGDIKEVSQSTGLQIWSQKVDPDSYGAHTGSVLAEGLKEDGAKGVILNHSENRFDSFEVLSIAHKRAKEVGLKTLIFTKNLEELERVVSLSPDFVSYEPPELIGSKEKSVASDPETIAKAAEIAKIGSVPLIVGAGVHSMEDVKKCIENGATGIAVASDVMAASDPKKEILDLVEGFK